MKTIHSLSIQALCPENGYHDTYHAEVTVLDKVLLCEDVLAAVQACTTRPIYQEQLTQDLADRLGAQVSTTGTHCHGNVRTTCTCQPKEGR